MKILYIANIRLPTEKAHGVQIMKTCEAFAAAGVQVELAVTDRATPITGDPLVYYEIKTRFAVTRLAVPDTVGWGKLGFWLESLSFARQARRALAVRRPDIMYGRDELVLVQLPIQCPLVWETHTGAWNRAARTVARRAHKIVAISQGLKDFYVARGVPAEKIIIARDGVDLAQFDIKESSANARTRIGIGDNRPIAMYTGSRYVRKGVQTFEKAGELLPDINAIIVSGRPYAEIPLYLRAADVLVLPNSAHDGISSIFTSPMKLFEYMAAGKPIIASDVPAAREVLDDSNAYFFTPDDPQSLADAIKKALTDPHASQKAFRAREEVKEYSWDTRAQTILRGL